ncbi:hypothetical protein ACQKJG_18915 [Priestia megaterium]|uniref:hypothetical protein n=1 Tax=Priestia megaterium TaxID=1404 RepID=UPI003CFE1729
MTYTHKFLGLDSETFKVVHVIKVSSPQVVTTKEFIYDNGSLSGIQIPFIVVEADFDESTVTKEMYYEYVKNLSLSHLEKKYKEAQVKLMSDCDDYEEYSQKEDALKKKFFNLKKQITLSENSLDIDISFD